MNKKYLIFGAVIIAVIVGFIFLSQKDEENSPQQTLSSNKLSPVSSITHGHGLGIDAADSNKVFIATHHGLLVLVNDKDLYRLGNRQDDYMGFSPHPTDSKVFFSSGHPSSGGNIGFQKSEDGGFTWEKVSDGLNGPVDFHAMTVSPVNPNLIYGWYRGALQRSADEGKNWEKFPTDFPVVNLAADPKDENVLYSASPQGLFVSKNKGQVWERLLDGFVSAIAINPQNSQNLISFTEKIGLAVSSDSGKNWEKTSESFGGETPLYISFYKQDPKIIYLLTEKNSIYKSTDGESIWTKIR